MKKSQIYILINISIFILSCVNNQHLNNINSNIDTIIINTNEIKNSYLFNYEKESVKYIPLETCDESLIGKIDKVIVFENKFYVLDKELTKSIFIFSSKGKYINKIKRIGKGPGEYIEPDDFTIDPLTGEILVLDYDQRKVIFFSNKTNFIKEKRFKDRFASICSTGDNIMGLSDYSCEGDCYKLFVFNKSMDIKKKISSYSGSWKRIIWGLTKPMFYNGKSVFLTDAFCDSIYEIDSNLNYHPKYFIDFGKKAIPPNMIKKNRDEFLEFISTAADKAFLVDNFMLNDKLMYFSFFYKQRMTHFLRTNDKTICVNLIGDDNNIFYYWGVFLDGKFLYFYTTPDLIIKESKNYNKLFKDLKEISNPIIVKIPINSL